MFSDKFTTAINYSRFNFISHKIYKFTGFYTNIRIKKLLKKYKYLFFDELLKMSFQISISSK
jgi:hypothetical protein